MSYVLIDSRWSGDHGIGRFSRVLDERLCLPHLKITGKPSSPVDPFKLLIAMLKLPKDCAVLNPGYNAPLFVVRPYIFTILDLNHIDRPENSSFFKRLYYRLIMRRAVHNAFKVLTISEFSRQRILDWSNIDPSRVVNVSCGVDPRYNTTVKPYVPSFRYLLCVSNRRAHKNEPRIVEAFAKANIHTEIRLLFTGPASKQLIILCKHLGVENRVSFLGRIPEEDLPGLYRGAQLLLFPSLYEGFGLPVVEAMACGIPVITSNSTSLAEVAGDAAYLVDPTNTPEIAHAVERILADDDLRKNLVAKGLERAKAFSWDHVAARVQAVINELR